MAVKQAALRPIHGVDKVLRWFAGVLARPESQQMEFELRQVNGELAIVALDRDGVDGVFFLTVEGDRITSLPASETPRSSAPSESTAPSSRFLRGPSAGLGLLRLAHRLDRGHHVDEAVALVEAGGAERAGS